MPDKELTQFKKKYGITIVKPNTILSHSDCIRKFSKTHLEGKKVVEGVIVTGSAAGDSSDDFSDIDFVVIVNKQKHSLINGKFRFEGHLLDCRVIQYNDLLLMKWSIEMKDAYSRGKILFDRSGKVKRVIKKNAHLLQKELTDLIVYALLSLASTTKVSEEIRGFKSNPSIYKKVMRKEITAAHLELSEQLDTLFKLVFALNGAIPVERKSSLSEVSKLKWLPKKFNQAVQAVIVVKELSLKDLLRRLKSFDYLFRECLKKANTESFLPKDIYQYYLENRGGG